MYEILIRLLPNNLADKAKGHGLHGFIMLGSRRIFPFDIWMINFWLSGASFINMV